MPPHCRTLPFQQNPVNSGFMRPAVSAAVQAFSERKQRILDGGLEFYKIQATGTLSDYARLQQTEPSVAAVRLLKSIPLPEEMMQALNKKFPNGIQKIAVASAQT